MTHGDSDELIDRMRTFLQTHDIALLDRDLPDTTLLPGVDIGPEGVYVDRSKLKHPGDILHEAGHYAVTESHLRPLIGSNRMPSNWPSDGDEVGAILWSYAACKVLELDPAVVFHPEGYKNESDWIIENLEKGNYLGLPLFEWMGFAYGAKRARLEGVEPYPKMQKWMRD